MNALKVDVSHLVGMPYQYGGTNPREGVDCLFASRAALELIYDDLEVHELPITADEEEITLMRIRAGESRWHKIGESAASARKIGDVIHGIGTEGHSYIAVLVDQVSYLALTAGKKNGVHLKKLSKLPGIVAVLRRSVRP